MIAVSPSEFAMAEGQRLRFVATAGTTEMQLLNADGTHVAYRRERAASGPVVLQE
jgi:hypothetical protein